MVRAKGKSLAQADQCAAQMALQKLLQEERFTSMIFLARNIFIITIF